MGRSPMRQPPRSGMIASPRRCRSGPQNRIGMRELPAWASMSATWAFSTFDGSMRRVPVSASRSVFTPWMASSSETIWTSRMSGTECSTLGCSPSSAATIALETRLFAPRTVISPLSGRPPRTWNVELMVSLLRWTGAPGRPVSDPVTLPEPPVRVPPNGVARSVPLGPAPRRGPQPPSRPCSAPVDPGRERLGQPGRPSSLEGGDVGLVAQGQADVVQALHQAPAGVVVEVEAEGRLARVDLALDQVDGDLGAGVLLQDLPDLLDVVLGQLGGHQALLAGVAAEDVGEAGGEHGLEAVVAQRPHRVLTRGAGAEVGAGHEHRAPAVCGLVQHEVGIAAPGGEQPVVEAGLGHALEVDGGDDLVGVDVAAAQRDSDAGVGGEGFHGVLLERRSA